jgi:hypothetical protein
VKKIDFRQRKASLQVGPRKRYEPKRINEGLDVLGLTDLK